MKIAKVSIQETVFLLLNILVSELEKVKYLAKTYLIIYIIVKTQIIIIFAIFMIS